MIKSVIQKQPKTLKKILLVLDQYDGKNNGTTITAYRLAQGLRKKGYEVRIVSTGQESNEKFTVPPLPLPKPIRRIISAQGMQFASPDKNILYNAISWADLVHFIMPFFLSVKGLKIAQKLNVPHTAAFHIHPQCITYSIGLGTTHLPNELIYYVMYNTFFKYFRHIHCPSTFIENQLIQRGYTAKLHVISNGIASDFCYMKSEKPQEFQGLFVILMIGRFSKEKRQDVLIEAVRLSRHSDKIQLIFAGKGPLKEKYERTANGLNHNPRFVFFEQADLLKTISYCDLYVHTADTESEAIACIEALACGLVPIIADAVQSAAPQFALDERSLFTAGNPASLAEKIDYWFEHPEERRLQEKAYAEYGKEFAHETCVEKMLEMFHDEMNES